VFQFYAAITKLKSPGIRQVIARIVEAKSKPLLVSLLCCLHEAQDPALCLYVAERLEYRLDLSETSLSPLDCLSVSFFLSSLSGKETSVHLDRCTIGDLGAKYLSKYLHVGSRITIDLASTGIHEEGALHVARMPLCFVEHLYLSYNQMGDTGASLISEAVRETATLKTLILFNCVITSRGAEDLSRALAQNSSIEKLVISLNSLGDEGISHVAEALKQNKQLKELWIGGCGMTDKGAASLASALTVNNSLKMLHMGGNKEELSEDGLSTIAHSLAKNSLFVKLAIPKDFGFTATAYRLLREVNEARKRNGLSPIEIKGEYTLYCVDVSQFELLFTCTN
jgi:Ran GTPase-activating protein (RanGAP) involved in mRNA processing and transport